MEVSVEELNEVQKKIQVKYPENTVGEYFQSAYSKIRGQARIKGFRPGKAPLSMLRNSHGDAAIQLVMTKIREDISTIDFYQKQDVEPFGTPAIYIDKDPKEGEDFEFHLIVDVPPTFTLTDCENKEVECPQYDIDLDVEVDQEISRRARNQATQTPVDDKEQGAEKNHAVSLTCRFLNDKGDVISEHDEKKPLEAILDEQSHLDPWIVDGILGMKVGENKTLDHEYEGQKIQLELGLLKVSTLNTPPIDDELAKDLGFENLNEMKKDIKARLEKELEKSNESLKKESIRAHILKEHPFQVPPSLVDNIIDHRLLRMGYPKDQLQNKEIREQQLTPAQEEARFHFLVAELGKKHNLTPTEEAITEELTRAVKENPQLQQGNQTALMQNIQWDLLSKAIFDHFASTLSFKIEKMEPEAP
ncbi:MAG: trigger factor [Oligoflexales bacterium]